jgi:dTDP-4-dehydrorhamnose reductase
MALATSAETGIRHVTATRVLSRVELADYLLQRLGLPASYRREGRRERAAPHLGYVELATRFRGELFTPLASVIDGTQADG